MGVSPAKDHINLINWGAKIARLFLVAGTLFFLLVCLLPSSPMCLDQKSKIEQGKKLHLAILDKHRKIDNFYRKPFVNGVLTSKPLLCISVPESDWESLPENKKAMLAAYVENLLDNLKSDPFMYHNGVDANAPSASTALKNIEKMSNESWGIMVGRISPDGRDIMSDRVAREGK